MQNIKQWLNNPVVISVLMAVFGLILILYPGATVTTLITMLGIGLAVAGAFMLTSWYRHRTFPAVDYVSCGTGLAALLGGIFVLSSPQFLKDLAPTLVGIGILVTGLLNLIKSLDQRKLAQSYWKVSAILAAVTIILGVVLISRASYFMDMMVRVVGVMLVYNGVSSLWIATRK